MTDIVDDSSPSGTPPFLLTIEHILKLDQHLTDGERAALLAWEHEHLGKGHDVGTTDWPGWSAVAQRADH